MVTPLTTAGGKTLPIALKETVSLFGDRGTPGNRTQEMTSPHEGRTSALRDEPSGVTRGFAGSATENTRGQTPSSPQVRSGCLMKASHPGG